MTILAHGVTRYSEKTKAEARALYALGETCAGISNRMGISLYLVRRWCDDAFRIAQNARTKAKRDRIKGYKP